MADLPRTVRLAINATIDAIETGAAENVVILCYAALVMIVRRDAPEHADMSYEVWYTVHRLMADAYTIEVREKIVTDGRALALGGSDV